ncbi:MAG: hypothetical protein AB1668_02675 [Nanoarchaeota archaeon]
MVVSGALKSLSMIIEQKYNVDLDDLDGTRRVALRKAKQISDVINGLIRSVQGSSVTEMREEIYRLLYSAVGLIDTSEATNGGRHDIAHLERVGRYAELLAWHHITDNQHDYPNYDAERYSRDLAKAAPLHDIGKVCLPGELLTIPGVFSSVQREIMKVHVDCGKIILTIEGCTAGKETRVPLARCTASEHHLPEYGSYACESQRPSLAGKIVKLVDGLDAGTSERIYDPAKPFEQVVDKTIANCEAGKYDQLVVATFLRHRREFKQLHDRLHDLIT